MNVNLKNNLKMDTIICINISDNLQKNNIFEEKYCRKNKQKLLCKINMLSTINYVDNFIFIDKK